MIKDYVQSIQHFEVAISTKWKKKQLIQKLVPLKQTEKGCIHFPVNSHESFNSRFPIMKWKIRNGYNFF